MFRAHREPEPESAERHDEVADDRPARSGDEERLVRRALALMPLHGVAAGIVLEVGCGSGRRAILLAQIAPGLRVIGVDSSAALIARARDGARAAQLDDRCRFVRGDPKRLPVASERFDAVLCDGLLHHLAAALPALNEIGRAASPAGAILIRDVRRRSAFAAGLVAAWLGLRSSPPSRPALAASLRAAFTAEELADLLRRSRLRGVHAAPAGAGHLLLLRTAASSTRSAP